MVTSLHRLHLPRPPTVVVGVLGPGERLVASASFAPGATRPNGWEYRNDLLDQLRRIVPHDLRRRVPVRTAVLLCCRFGEPEWTQLDGAWMWALRDACTLHGLRCGAYLTLTPSGWQVLGGDESGKRPSAGPVAGRRNDGTEAPPADTADQVMRASVPRATA
nr:hypothetical protein [Streptomyces albus]